MNDECVRWMRTK